MATPSTRLTDIDRELDRARRDGPLRDIIIPPCPQLLLELQAEVQTGDPDPAEIARIAGADVAMAAALLHMSNSSLYARSRQPRTVAQAVAMLGVAPTVTALTSFLLRQTIAVNSPLLEHFWETSTRRALAMGYIARQLYEIDPEQAHLCGLFCHVGIPVMMQGVRGYASTLVEALARQDRSFTETENAAHRTDHAVVGAIVARTWHLPASIAAAIRLHHDFSVLPDQAIAAEVRTLVAVSAVAEHLVGLFEQVQQQREWAQHGDACLRMLQVSEGELEQWLDALHPTFESVTSG